MRAMELREGKLQVTILLRLFNPSHNHDKLVTVLLEVLDGAEVVARTTLGPIEVEEGDTKSKSFPFVIPTAVLKIEEAMKMRLTVTTKDF